MAAEVNPAPDQTEVVRWYTHARRFPILIGKAGMNGDPLPGGPYTSTQVVAWFGTLAVLYLTRDVWGVFDGFTNGLLLLGIPILVGWAARWIPHDARNPMLVAAGWVRCFGAPPEGRVDGIPVRLRREYRLRHQYVVDPRSYAADLVPRLRESWAAVGESTGSSDPSPRFAQSRREEAQRERELTGVQALLAGRR
jgi:hypothetical protein